MDNLGPSQAYDFYKSGVSTGGDTGLHAPYLGPNPREQKMTAWEQRSHAKWNMPDAYLGENRRLRDTMEDYMITAQFDWYTERIMPWFKSEDIEFEKMMITKLKLQCGMSTIKHLEGMIWS